MTIAEDAGGTPEIVEEGVTGLLHPVGEIGQDRLAENILALVRDRRRAGPMGKAGVRRVRERFASDPARNRWRVSMRPLPLPRKGGVVWENDGFLYFNGGQVAVTNDSHPVLAETMAARIERRSWLDWSRLWS